jgi:hypothetical protein
MGAGTAPAERRLTPRPVVVERGASVIVGAAGDVVLVVGDRVGAHHAHPGHSEHSGEVVMTSQATLANVLSLSASIRLTDLPEKRPCHPA